MSDSSDNAQPTPTGLDLSQFQKKTALEISKLCLENAKLTREKSLAARAALTLTPLITAFVAILGVVLSLIALYVQGKSRADESNEKAFQQALSMATDPKGGADRRISGIYQLQTFWDGKEQIHVVAATLSSLLILPDSVQDASSIRCAAVSVIRDGLRRGREDSQKSILMNLFFSKIINPEKIGRHEIGEALLTRPNRMIARMHPVNIQPVRFGTDDQYEEVNNCSTPIAATKAAIRLFYKYFDNINLGALNLDNTNLNSANLHNAELSDTSIRGASLRCANLSEADLTNLKLDDARLGFANIYQADTEMSNGIDIRKSLIERGAIEIANIK